jgi:superfamily I DNA/RNA helicase
MTRPGTPTGPTSYPSGWRPKEAPPLDPEPSVAILYRKHRLGEYLEGRLLRAGIPCRLARGRALIEDAVIGYVVAALRIVRMPEDTAALQAFARIVLSAHFLQEVEAALDEPVAGVVALRGARAKIPTRKSCGA